MLGCAVSGEGGVCVGWLGLRSATASSSAGCVVLQAACGPLDAARFLSALGGFLCWAFLGAVAAVVVVMCLWCLTLARCVLVCLVFGTAWFCGPHRTARRSASLVAAPCPSWLSYQYLPASWTPLLISGSSRSDVYVLPDGHHPVCCRHRRGGEVLHGMWRSGKLASAHRVYAADPHSAQRTPSPRRRLSSSAPCHAGFSGAGLPACRVKAPSAACLANDMLAFFVQSSRGQWICARAPGFAVSSTSRRCSLSCFSCSTVSCGRAACSRSFGGT